MRENYDKKRSNENLHEQRDLGKQEASAFDGRLLACCHITVLN